MAHLDGARKFIVYNASGYSAILMKTYSDCCVYVRNVKKLTIIFTFVSSSRSSNALKSDSDTRPQFYWDYG